MFLKIRNAREFHPKLLEAGDGARRQQQAAREPSDSRDEAGDNGPSGLNAHGTVILTFLQDSRTICHDGQPICIVCGPLNGLFVSKLPYYETLHKDLEAEKNVCCCCGEEL
jgi:hypothetical protein